MYRFFLTPKRIKFINWFSPIFTLFTAANAYLFAFYAVANMQFHLYNKKFKQGIHAGTEDAIWQTHYRLKNDFAPDQPQTQEAYFNGFMTGILSFIAVLALGKILYYAKEKPKSLDYVYPSVSLIMTLIFSIAYTAQSLQQGLPGNSPYSQGYYYGYQANCSMPDDPNCLQNTSNPYDYQIQKSYTLLVIMLAISLVVNLTITTLANMIKGFVNCEDEEVKRLLPTGISMRV